MVESNAIFTTNESRGVIKFLCLQGKSVKDIHGDMSQTLVDQCPSYSTVKNWVDKFKMDHFSTNDNERLGRPRVVVVPEIVDAVHNLILENQRISSKAIADIMGISRECVFCQPLPHTAASHWPFHCPHTAASHCPFHCPHTAASHWPFHCPHTAASHCPFHCPHTAASHCPFHCSHTAASHCPFHCPILLPATAPILLPATGLSTAPILQPATGLSTAPILLPATGLSTAPILLPATALSTAPILLPAQPLPPYCCQPLAFPLPPYCCQPLPFPLPPYCCQPLPFPLPPYCCQPLPPYCCQLLAFPLPPYCCQPLAFPLPPYCCHLYLKCAIYAWPFFWLINVFFFRFLATGESYTSLHLQFRVGRTTISRIVRCTCAVICQKLQPMVMPSPTEETWLQVAAGFQSVANFPNCISAVDGKHVRVLKPPRSGSHFFNYKKYFSVVLMAVADAHCKFVAIDVGAYGSTGDSRVLRASQIGQQILRDGGTLPAPRPLPGSTHPVPFVMVSDEAFPLKSNLLRPYPRRALDDRRRVFNYRLSRARRYVECTFGIMCSQWRIFHTAIQLDTQTADTVIKACCVLHNYAREYATDVDEESQLSDLNAVSNLGQGRVSNSGVLVQETFTDYFMSPEGAVHWQYSCAGVEQPGQQRIYED
ncbi:uncharacterized protein [Dendrobates tinctorius]|uniref:uncharacterized protein n=1 Tax=Dendrobates tinctorius TaxID=92724 RepID=UPI003CC9D24A